MMTECHAGQRWISNTEPELGLGIVFEVANRRVVMNFPAGDERRTYALDNAPLTRVRYRAGDCIRTEDGAELIVASVQEIDGCLIYGGIDARGHEQRLHEIDLDSFVQFSRPLDRLFTGQVDRAARYRLRTQTLTQQHRQRAEPAYGLVGSRVALLPHQFYIADEVANRFAPRVLLADEVGLGKTIEAGLILHRQLLRGAIARVLIVTPPNLVHQWLVEMLRRFNLMFSVFDAETLDELGASDAANPFESAQLVLCSLDQLSSDPVRLAQAVAAGWDMLIVDEAHHLTWSPSETSAAYAAVAALAARVAGLLLLTATPQQLGVAGHFARLRLLDPHRYSDLSSYIAEEQRYTAVSSLVERVLGQATGLDEALLREITGYLGERRTAEMRGMLAETGDGAGVAARIVRELLDHHGTGRVLFRNSRDHMSGFPQRRLLLAPLPCPSLYAERASDTPDVAGLLWPERGLGEDWLTFDPRVGWLERWVAAHRRDKALVICTSTETAQSLEAWMRLRRGVRSAVFHEGLDLVARDRAAAYFADPEEDAQLLICSEIGSEGRNFQFARHLILFDLPLNPDLLEQRIGRLDRIGQGHEIEIHVPYFEGAASEVMQRWLHEGLDAFERTCPIGPAVLETRRAALLTCLRNPGDCVAVADLLEATRAQARDLRETLRQGRDRLLERNSFDAERALAIVSGVTAAERPDELRAYMELVLDEFGVEHEENGQHGLVLHPGDHMTVDAFPGLPEGGLTVTFSRSAALARDDIHFLTWEHPMVTGAMDLVLGSEFGNATFGVVKSAALVPGSVLVETQFSVVCPAPREYDVRRYLPHAALRMVIDAAGEEVGTNWTAAWLDGAMRDVPLNTAQKVIARMRDQVNALVDHATHLAEVAGESLVERSVRGMRVEVDAEITRLRQLAAVNPNIREDELSYLESRRTGLERYLRGARLKLDAVRIAVAT
jgi:ATP-dependent helicase HepA